MDLSIMFFGADDAGPGSDHATKYEDVLAITRAADRLGFKAVWSPERHFQQVGQIFPNPALLAAALAVSTEQIELRAGSVVLPLQHPLRVVEDWAVVDNLSYGRVGLSIATGWHSTDFVLAPDRYENRRSYAWDTIPVLRELWSGAAMSLLDGAGRSVDVHPQPRPVSATLPLWLTASGRIETWLAAGRMRTNVLSTTIGENREGLAEKINRYQRAYAEAAEPTGGPDRGIVTLMAHTYVGCDDAEVVDRVTVPLRKYVRSHVAQSASSHRSQGPAGALSDSDLDKLTDFALRRYLAWGSLLGSAETCLKTLNDLGDIGCDEVACFIDFGLGVDEVITTLHRLADLRTGITA